MNVKASRYLNVISIGYALFFAMNMAAMWGSSFPFMPPSIQTPENFAAFYYPSLSFEAGFFGIALLSYRMGARLQGVLIYLAAIPYLLGWLCLIALASLGTPPLATIGLSGLFLGWGTAGFFLVWQQIFAAQDIEASCHSLVVGTMLAACIYLAMNLLRTATVALFIPCVVFALFLTCAIVAAKRSDFEKPWLKRTPAQEPATLRRMLKDYWRSAFCLGIIGFCSGATRNIAITDPDKGIFVNVVSMTALFVAAAVFLYVWNRKPLNINTTVIFRAVSPLMLVLFALAPFLGSSYLLLLAGILFALIGCAVVLMTLQSLNVSSKRNLQPVLVFGLFAGCVWMLYDFGYFASDVVLALAGVLPYDPAACITVLCTCALGLGLFIGQGGMSSILSPHQTKADHIELMRTAATPASRSRTTSTVGKKAEGDPLSAKSHALKEHYFLTDREEEIAQLVARGFTVKKISETLTISENTVRTHMKSIYEKLDIHKKTDLIGLIDRIEVD